MALALKTPSLHINQKHKTSYMNGTQLAIVQHLLLNIQTMENGECTNINNHS